MAIEARGIWKRYGKKDVLKNVDLLIPDGAFCSIVAPTGAGKTTLLRILAGLEHPDKGQVLYDGVDVTRVPVAKRNIAFVHQWFVNYPSMTVYDNLAAPLRAAGYDKNRLDARVRQVASLLRIDKLLTQRPHELSGGQQQRCSLARALVREVKQIFLDEPLTNLDAKLQEELCAELRSLFGGARQGSAVYATPQPTEALSLSTSIALIDDGRIIQHGPTTEVWSRPATVTAGKILGRPPLNVVKAQSEDSWIVASSQFRLPGHALGAPIPSGACFIGIRPHAISLLEKPGHIAIDGQVELSEVVGSESEIHLEHQGHTLVIQVSGIHRPAMGSRITAWIDPATCHCFAATGELVAAAKRA